MGVTSRLRDIRPPLPAPTESNDEGGTTSGPDTDVATNITTQTDITSFEIPENGKPVVLREHKHGFAPSQTSLLIEYFEGSKGDKTRSKPSVRVKVTPSARKKSGSGGPDAIQITSIGKDRKTSYTRRISLNSRSADVGGLPTATEVSHSSGSNVSGRPPIEVEMLDHNGSDLSTQSRGLIYGPSDSNVSSMPPDSMLEGSNMTESERGDDDVTVKDGIYLNAPQSSKDRNASRERLTQKVMEKLNQSQTPTPRKSSRSKSDRNLSEYASKSRQFDSDTFSGADSSVLTSNTGKQSYRSGSDVSNNPKLLGMVEDTIRRIILPEINAIKEDQRTDRKMRSYETGSRQTSLLDDLYTRNGLNRSLSKSSSSPNISSKPKVVLNRDGEDPGVVLSRGDSERKKMRKSSRGSYTEERPSSRRSSGRTSSRTYDDDDTIRAKSSKSSTKLRDIAATGVASGMLTGAALKSLEFSRDSPDQRKRRSKSRGSRRSSGSRRVEEESYLEENVPLMPMASHINDSEVTRSSLVSDATATPHVQTHTAVHEVSRRSLRDAMSPATVGSSPRTPGSRSIGVSQNTRSFDSPKSLSGLSTKERLAALAAAGVAGAGAAKVSEEVYDRHVDADGYGGASPITYRKTSSPMQSVSSLKQTFEEESLKPQELRPRSAAPRSSAGREKSASKASLRSGASSPSTKLARPQSSRTIDDGYATEYATPAEEFARETTPGTPTYGESVDDWYERQHQVNDGYRHSLEVDDVNRDSFAKSSNRDSYQTNPYPQDEKRFTFYSEDDQEGDRSLDDLQDEHDIRGIGANPQYIHTPHGAESAVASLILEPSNVSSGQSRLSTADSPITKANTSFSARLRDLGKDSPPLYQGSTVSQTMPSQDRWKALKGHARDISTSRDILTASPQQAPLKTVREERSAELQPIMSASGLPLAEDPLPEIGHYDDTKSEVSTNASIVREPLGGDATGKDTWPYTPDPAFQAQRGFAGSDGQSMKSGGSRGVGMTAAAAAGATALAGAHALRQPSVEDDEEDRLTPDIGRGGRYIDREATPTSAAGFRDEGYATDAHARSSGALTPEPEQRSYSKNHVDEYNRAMAAYEGEKDDPFTGTKEHSREVSGNSHGMAPLYDATTGQNIKGIDSKDIVALMDHLTVRDAQRNARDTEILVSLVRSTAEMRDSFNDIKKFIAEQDRMIMQSTDRSVDQTVQKALNGPRPLPGDSPRTPRLQSQEDIQTKRKGVLRRALKGLTGSKSANDLAKVEGMLMQILDNVEDLKHQGGSGAQRDIAGSVGSPYTTDSLDSYERLRNVPDSGYEPEGQAGTSSTPSHSGGLSLTPRGEKQQFHSGYDGRRNSVNRVSTVLEGDEEELEPHEAHVLENQFEHNEGFLTPTQENQRARGFTSPMGTPPHNGVPYGGLQPDEITPRSTDKQRKHKSTSSSVFGAPKVSRWSKTTTSSAAPDPATLDSPNVRNRRPVSEASSRTESSSGYGDKQYELRDDDRLSSKQSFARDRDMADNKSMRSQVSKMTRTPSPLIPSEASINQRDVYDDEPSPIQEDLDYELDDPKYQAHRNSLLLQHPQPRQGPTARHQNTLETHAHTFDVDDVAGTSSDLSQRSVSDFDPATWGSSGTAGLAKHRLSHFEPISPESMNSPATHGRYGRDNDSLIPQAKPAPAPVHKVTHPQPEPEDDWEHEEPTYSNSGFSRGGYYSSPFGSGHLLEPIEEVESIISVEREQQLSPEPTISSAQAVDMRTNVRKITGPRPMGSSRSPSQNQPKLVETTGTVRRKPVRGSGYE